MHRPFCTTLRTVLGLAALVAAAPAAWAQAPAAPAPPPVWAGSAGLGLAVTSGNADTSSFNITGKGTWDPMNPHKATFDALYLRGSSDGDLVINRLTFGGRDDYSLTDRASVFGQLRYLRDTFKAIDYLVAPTVGLAYKIIATAPTTFAVDAGVGGVWEKNPGFDTQSSGAIVLGQNFSHKLSGTATITEAASGLWKTSDFGDVLYTFGAGVSAAITPRSTIKLELLETYKTQPPSPAIEKQDVAFITSLVYTF